MDNEKLVAEAMSFLSELGINADRPSPYHVKFGRLNYWPCKGTIMFDGEPRLKERGLQALGDVVRAYLHQRDRSLPHLQA